MLLLHSIAERAELLYRPDLVTRWYLLFGVKAKEAGVRSKVLVGRTAKDWMKTWRLLTVEAKGLAIVL